MTLGAGEADGKASYVAKLEAAYGPPSQSGFGSAVFNEVLDSSAGLEQAALKYYKTFVGDKWQRFGEQAWMSAWKKVYTRKAGAAGGVIDELNGISDPQAKLSVPMILDVVENAEAARKALSAAFDDAEVADLQVYNVGDGAAMTGILVAGRRSNGEATFLVFLMD